MTCCGPRVASWVWRATSGVGRIRCCEPRSSLGADGLHSTVARSTGANAYREHPALTGVLYSYWSGLSHFGARFYARPGQLILVWPTNDDLTCIYVAWPHQMFRQVRKDPQESFRAALALVPDLADAVASGQREHRFVGTDDLPNLYRTSAGPGWALAGDAGHHKDPSTGMGMSDAFASAELLADAIDRGLVGDRPFDDALSNYQDERDALTANGFELTLSTARLAPLSPRLEAFYRAAADQPEVDLPDLRGARRFAPDGRTLPGRAQVSRPLVGCILNRLGDADAAQWRQAIELAETAGLDHLAVGDHVAFHTGAGSDGLLAASTVLGVSDRLSTNTAVYLLPLRHPLLVARQLADMSVRAPGRFTFGVGIGGEDRHEVEACGVDPATRGRRMDECIQAVRQLLTGATRRLRR
jgi:hypothetical protein